MLTVCAAANSPLTQITLSKTKLVEKRKSEFPAMSGPCFPGRLPYVQGISAKRKTAWFIRWGDSCTVTP